MAGLSERSRNQYGRRDNDETLCLVPPFPNDMLVELTNRCNHKCAFCFNSRMTRPGRQMDKEFYLGILARAHGAGTRQVGLYSTGEPFMVKDFPWYVSRARQQGFEYIYISTNGELAGIEVASRAIEAGLNSIKFSVNAGSPETYELVHGRDCFGKVMDNIRAISEHVRGKELDVSLFATIVRTRHNVHEVEGLKASLEDMLDEVAVFNVGNQGGLLPENRSLALAPEEFSRVSLPCVQPFRMLNVTCEGYLTGCCIDYQNMLCVADLNKETLVEAWRNKRFQALRRMHLEGRPGRTMCAACVGDEPSRIVPFMKTLSCPPDGEVYHESPSR